MKKFYTGISGRPALFFVTAGLFAAINFIIYFSGNADDRARFVFLVILWASVMFMSFRMGLSNPRISLPVVILLSAGLFLYKYGGAGYFNSFVFRDDLPAVYWVTEQGIKMLKQGGIFGWDSTFFGGYYNLADISPNLAFFVFPFSLVFGLKTGFNLFYFFIFISFSPLFYIYSRALINDARINAGCLWMSFFVLCTFFLNTLIWGNLEVFLGLELLVVNLIVCESFLKKARLSGFLLVTLLTLTLYAHPAFFLYSLLIVFVRILADRGAGDLIRYAYVLVFVLLATLPFSYPLIKYNRYFTVDAYAYSSLSERFAPLNMLRLFKIGLLPGFKQIFFDWARSPVLSLCKSYVTIFSVVSPVFLYVCLYQKNNFRKSLFSLAAGGLIVLAFKGLQSLIINRIDFVFAAMIILALGHFLALYHGKIIMLLVLSFITVYCFLFPPDYILSKIGTISGVEEYNSALVSEIKALEGNLVLFEQGGNWNYIQASRKNEASERPVLDIHFEPLMARETSKRFFSGIAEGYHIHMDRYNTLISGTYKGKKVSDRDISVFNDLFQKWGIEYLALWTNESKRYFSKHKDLYEEIWSDKEWVIYRYKYARPEPVSVKRGYGSVEHQDFYRKTLRLSDMLEGEEVLLKSNYFPAWKAYFNGKRVDLREKDRQVLFNAPANGSYSIKMVFPKYAPLSIVSIASLFLALALSLKKLY